MESTEFIIISVGGILAIMLFILIKKKKSPRNEIMRLSNEIEIMKNEVSTRDSNIQANLNTIGQLKNTEKEHISTIQQKDQLIQNLNFTIVEFKDKERQLIKIISEMEIKIEQLNQDINNLQTENLRQNNIITNHKNNIPNILKIRKDNTDLFFFYRELYKPQYIT